MALNLKAIGDKFGPLDKEYGWKEVALYALGVGSGFDELEYVWEDSIKVLPSFSIASVFEFLAETGIKANADLSRIFHGEQDIYFHNPIPTQGSMHTEGEITGIYDKGKDRGALVVSRAETFHSNGQKLFTNIFTLFCKNDGGFGGEPGEWEKVVMPERNPDFVEVDRSNPNQPLLYRLTGDIFALHVDPRFARAAGFEKPIMHGLCTHGFACRAVIKQLMPGEPERMSRFRVRFAKPFYPGMAMKTVIWQEGEGRALFQTLNAESGEVVLDGGVVEWISREQAEARAKRGGIRFDGQVAIVTGAGAGLGRAYALELARRGARVLVNDLGVSSDGSGASRSPADLVVAEITQAGGEALSNYDSVATAPGGAAIVQAALDAWGRVDVLINNAGILRDKTLVKMEPEMWQAVLEVHLSGAYHVTRPAFAAMKGQGYGRIVFTTSAASLYGNFGQTNYSAAKLGLVGFANTLKLEGESSGVKVNTVAPIAGTRLTQDLLPPDLFARLKPEFVAPLVVYLASEQCPVSGHVYNTGLGFINRAAVITGHGAMVGDGATPPTPKEVARSMERIKSLKGGGEFPDAASALGFMLDAVNTPADPSADPAPSRLSVAEIMEGLPDSFQKDVSSGLDTVFQFRISGPQGGEWCAVIQDQTCVVKTGEHEKPTTVIKMSDEDFLALMSGSLSPMTAYTSGKLRIDGDIMKSQLLSKLFRI